MNEIDTTNFDKFDEEEPWYVEEQNKNPIKNHFKDKDFKGYSYKRSVYDERSPIIQALQELENSKPS